VPNDNRCGALCCHGNHRLPELETNTTWNINQPINHDQTGPRRFQTNLGDSEEITLKQ